MPNFYILRQDLMSTHYGVLGATPADDASKIKAKYLERIIHSDPEHPDIEERVKKAYAILSSPQEREKYDEELYQKTLAGRILLTDAELAEFTNIVSIMLHAVAPHKADLLLQSVGSGMYAIGDFFAPTDVTVVDPSRVLTTKEQAKFKALFKVLAQSHGGTIADIVNSDFVIFQDKVSQSQFGQELFSAQQVRGFFRHLKRDGEYIPLEEIAGHFRKVEQVSDLFNRSSGLGCELQYGLLYMIDERTSPDAEKIGGFLAPRLQGISASSPLVPDEDLIKWFGPGVKIETVKYEVEKGEGHAPSQKTARMIPKDSLESIYANKRDEIAEMNRGARDRLAQQQAISRFYRAIQGNNKDGILAEIEEMKRMGIDLTSLNKNVALSPILCAARYGADNATLNLLLKETKPHFTQQPFGFAILTEMLARVPLFVMSDRLSNERLQSAVGKNPAEYEAEKRIVLQMKELSDHNFFHTKTLFNVLNNMGIEFLISAEKDAVRKLEMERIYSKIRPKHHPEVVPALVQHAVAAAKDDGRRAEHSADQSPSKRVREGSGGVSSSLEGEAPAEDSAMSTDTPSQATQVRAAAQPAKGRGDAARGDKN